LRKKIHQDASAYAHTSFVKTSHKSAAVCIGHQDCSSTSERTTRRKKIRLHCTDNPQQKYFNYFVFNSVGCALPRSGARQHALAQTIGNARGLDINSPLSAEAHTQDLRFHRYQQSDDPNNARGLDNNFASDRGCVIRLKRIYNF
jgi:hypothetical protein